jgi:cytidyltransferase-like protein
MKFSDFLREQKEKHAVLAFGRMNPITSGHEKLVNKVKDIADNVGGSHHIVLSHSQDPKKNPLTAAQKVKHAKRAFPGTNFTAANKDAPNIL